ncbi:MAG TPA: riboflavin synthase [Pyrinomonadaceae bacterium]|nr:riboflavin synthase [Pyrinomonadaceae bacterium]
MFTGIIEEIGQIVKILPLAVGFRYEIAANKVLQDITPGDSIAVNGVCLTAVELSQNSFFADVSPETASRTTLGNLGPQTFINLERAVSLSTRLGGHLVQGHVDCTGRLLAINKQSDDFYTLRFSFPSEISKHLIFKGSIAVDGISLTIASLSDDSFEVAIIPKTWNSTNLQYLAVNQKVNLEVDLIAKYVEKLFLAYRGTSPQDPV